MQLRFFYCLIFFFAIIPVTSASGDQGTSRKDYGQMILAPADAGMVLRKYYILDIVLARPVTQVESGESLPTEQALVNSIPKTMARRSWAIPSRGAGVIDYFPITGELIVYNTPSVHRRIERLLQDLRDDIAKDTAGQ